MPVQFKAATGEHDVYVCVPDIVPFVHILVSAMDAHDAFQATEDAEYAVPLNPLATEPQGVPVQPGVQAVDV